MLQMTRVLTLRLLLAAKQAGLDALDGPLVGAKIALFTTAIAPSPALVLADLVEATFPGYARSAAIVWGAPFTSSETGEPVMPGDAKTFTSTGGDPPETVRSYGLVSADVPPVLLALEEFEAPEDMGDGAVKVLLPRIGLNPDAVTPPGVEALT